MKKLILLLVLLPCISFAVCPSIPHYKILCKTDRRTDVVIMPYDVPTTYHVAAPECKVSDPNLVDSTTGKFRIGHIRVKYCNIPKLTSIVKVGLVEGLNYIPFVGYVKGLRQIWLDKPVKNRRL